MVLDFELNNSNKGKHYLAYADDVLEVVIKNTQRAGDNSSITYRISIEEIPTLPPILVEDVYVNYELGAINENIKSNSLHT